MAAGTRCDVAGWGVINHSGRKPDLLQHLVLPVIDRTTCNLRKYHDGTVTERMMCAESQRRKDSCKVWGGAEGGALEYPVGVQGQRNRQLRAGKQGLWWVGLAVVGRAWGD